MNVFLKTEDHVYSAPIIRSAFEHIKQIEGRFL